ncbi:hypothetical protein ACIBQ6_19325 [Nonomuraea sp. NPDC049655]|uniref:hypothetical protein n=1 Tax=Nonomuraea sp. NPDC049655 TaxID=3364355 RepID=UPI00379030EA
MASSRGIADVLLHAKDSIRYVGYGFAGDVRLNTALVRNAAGQYVPLSPDNAGKASRAPRFRAAKATWC